MVLRIEKVSDGLLMIFRLSGRLQSEHVDQLRDQIEGSTQRVVLDLEEVKLVDRDCGALPRTLRGKRCRTQSMFSLHSRLDRQGESEPG